MQVGDEVKIKMSPQLQRLGIANLSKKKGVIAKLVHSDSGLAGALVDFKYSKSVKRVFVPEKSIESAGEVNKKRNESILRAISL